MANPSHAAPAPPTVQIVRRWAFRILALDVVVLTVLGIALAFGYTPSSGLSDVHGILGIVAVVAALVAAAATVADGERSTAGVLPAIVVLGVVAGMYLTGPVLAWTGVVRTGPEDPKGVVVAFDDDVLGFVKGDDTITVDDYKRNAYLHVVALPIALVVMGGAGLWAVRRRRSYVPQRASVDSNAG